MQMKDHQLLQPLTQMLSKLLKAFPAWLPLAFPKSDSYLSSWWFPAPLSLPNQH